MRLKLFLPAVFFACGTTAMVAQAGPVLKPPCSLLTEQAAAALYGGPIGKKGEMAGGIIENCVYNGTKTDDAVAGLMMMGIPEHADPNSMFELALKGDGQGKAEAVSGVGERAAFLTNKSLPTTSVLTVLSHKTVVTLSVERPDGPAARAALLAGMKQIISKM